MFSKPSNIDPSERREIDAILNDLGPNKSKKAYDKEFSEFINFIQKNTEPSESDFLQYFDTLRRVKHLKASTLWSKYSMLNGTYHIKYGKRLQTYPRLTALLKSYNADYTPKQAAVFTLPEIHAFLRKPLSSSYWIIRKAICVVRFCGGLRSDELMRISYSDLTQTPDGIMINVIRAKQISMQQSQRILIPENKVDPTICMKSHLMNYVNMVMAILSEDPNGRLWRGCSGGKGFVKQNCGHNTLSGVGKDVAKELGIANYNAYTGHCWRRSAATEAAANGANTMQLKKGFNWTGEKQPSRYVDNTARSAKEFANLVTGQIRNASSSSDTTTSSTFPSNKEMATIGYMNANGIVEETSSTIVSSSQLNSFHTSSSSLSSNTNLVTIGYVNANGIVEETGSTYVSNSQLNSFQFPTVQPQVRNNQRNDGSEPKIGTINMGDNCTLNFNF